MGWIKEIPVSANSAKITEFEKSGILEQLSVHHKNQLDLCNRLEGLADRLPNNVDRQECLSMSWQIFPVVREAHKFEEETLFPALYAKCQTEKSLQQSLERLKFEHWEDESTAEDISLSLRELVSDPVSANTEKLSYMLRCFFEGVRRHIAFEVDHIKPKFEELVPAN